eukprot:PhF_6_TR43506/c0_g1_i1/m.66785/K00008/SORD, gutB; L-iditol 2-dehydrogenase
MSNTAVYVEAKTPGKIGPMNLKFGSRSAPSAPGPNEVLIDMRSVGICGSDVHYWQHGRIGDFIVEKPMVLGHESSGLVVSVGAGVTHLKAGDRVTIEPGVPCRGCGFCKTGRYNLCPDVKFLATPPYDGSMQSTIVWAADYCYKLPENVSYEEGAMCEPLSVGVFACQRGGVRPGSNVLVTGAGPIGLMCMLAAKAFGAASVTVTDLRKSRADLAAKLGADSTTLPTAGSNQRLFDVTMECTGAPSAIAAAIKHTKSGGVVCCVGLGPAEVKLPLVDAAVREVDIRGIFRYSNTYPLALSMIATKQVDVKPLITHRYPFTERAVRMAFDAALKGECDNKKPSIKVIVNVGNDKPKSKL